MKKFLWIAVLMACLYAFCGCNVYQPYKETEEIYLGANFDFALFDADMGVLYYYEYDS